jgi:hypothetical protein
MGTFDGVRPDYSGVPEETLSQVAMQVESAIAAGERTPALSDTGGVVVTTESILQAIRTRAARRELVDGLLDSGYAVQERSGLIAIQRTKEYKKSTTGEERNRHALIVLSENNDRWAIYEGIRKAGTFAPSALNAIQDTFYRAQVANLASGQHYETPEGEIVAK